MGEVGTSPTLLSNHLTGFRVMAGLQPKGRLPAAGEMERTGFLGARPDGSEVNDQSEAEDQDTGDLASGRDEDALDDDPLDTDRVTSTDPGDGTSRG